MNASTLVQKLWNYFNVLRAMASAAGIHFPAVVMRDWYF
jgi:hypothetical protein